ncbi:MAG: phosphoglycerate kinase [Acidobacteria bacterium]|nr:phosphoglycerate kinase [Acidobacteriota bacterium]
MTKHSIRDLELSGQRVFIRVDFNVPIKSGKISDETRMTSSLPTIEHALEHGATVVLASHLGRPKGKPAPEFSLKPVATRLAELLKRDVVFAEDCIGVAAERPVQEAHAGGKVVLLENLRFHAEEEANDDRFAAALAGLADVYVNDAFGAAHRAHASVAAIVPRFGDKAVAGLLMEKELRYLGLALGEPDRPFVGILGGAKVSDKIEVIENLLSKVDRLLIGGAMAYTFFRALGLPTGKSLVEEDKLDAARDIITHAKARDVELNLPVDHVVANKIEAGIPTEILKVNDPRIGDRMGLDIGPETTKLYSVLLRDAKTVVWNGPMGVFEIDAFAAGTLGVARAVADVRGTTIIGGGDSVSAINNAGLADRVTHISTGGGASLEFLGGQTLPGVAALPDK